jgi:hypothetical protein
MIFESLFFSMKLLNMAMMQNFDVGTNTALICMEFCNILFNLLLNDIRNAGGLITTRDSSVSMVSGYVLDHRTIEVRSPSEARVFFFYPLCPDRLWGPHDADHSPPSSAKVENE